MTVERHAALAQGARRMLELLGYTEQAVVVESDGTLGWRDGAPYDRVLVTAGAPALPQACLHQLNDPGRIVIPIGDRAQQNLMVYALEGGRWSQRKSIACRFVPLVGAEGWPQ